METQRTRTGEELVSLINLYPAAEKQKLRTQIDEAFGSIREFFVDLEDEDGISYDADPLRQDLLLDSLTVLVTEPGRIGMRSK